MLSTFQTIGERLKYLRTEAGISQDDMAAIMGISRMTYITTESGNREPKKHELENIAKNFEVSMEALNGISKEKQTIQRTPENDPNYRFKQALLYILSKCGQRPNIGKTILNKLLYFSDFNFYEKNGERSITGAQYVKLPFWPVPSVMDGAIAEMIADKQLYAFDSTFWDYPQKRLIPQVEPDLSSFTVAETQEMDSVIGMFADKTANWISEYSHEDTPYKATKKIGDPISYGLAFYRTPQYSVRPPEVYEN